MAEKAYNYEGAPKRERFEFKLTVNDNIICQRFFRINGFKSESYGSIDIVDAIDNCVELINRDLRDKSQMFLEYTAPQVLQSQEELTAWTEKHKNDKEKPMFILVVEDNNVYTWKDGVLSLYDKNFNRNDYVSDKYYAEDEDDNKNYSHELIKNENGTWAYDAPKDHVNFKFAFFDNGREVISKAWAGDVYPRFIRTNVDLSNSRNKYRQDGIFAPIESYMIEQFIKTKTDLIPSIVKEICSACSYDDADEYTSTVKYGGKTYDLNIYKTNRKNIRNLENILRKKTAEYFRHI